MKLPLRIAGVLGLGLFASWITTTRLSAQSLQVDAGFIPRITRPTWIDFVAAQPDGKLIVYGAEAAETQGQPIARVVRFARDGSLDPTFRFDEVVTESGYTDLRFNMLPNGKLLVFRNPSNGNQFSSFVRYNADGSLDDAFQSAAAPSGEFIGPWTVDTQGRIYTGGRYPDGWGLYRLNADGRIDPTFRTIFDSNGYAASLMVRPDGRLLVAGNFSAVNGATLSGNPGFVRLDTNGALDPTFTYRGNATPGVRITAMLPDARLLGGTTINGRSTVVRLSEDGVVDATFALADAVTFNVERALLLPDGRIAVALRRITPAAGQSRYALSVFRADGSLQVEHAAVLPLTLIAGLPDSTAVARDNEGNTFSFAADGRQIANPFSQLRAVATPDHILPLRNGGVLITPVLFSPGVGGISPRYDSINGLPRSGLVRLKSDGSVDSNFAPPPLANGTREVLPLVEASDGALFVSVLPTAGNIALLRLRPDGSSDDTFNRNARDRGGPTGAYPLPEGQLLCVDLAGRFSVLDREGRFVRQLPIEVDRSWDIALHPIAGGRIAVSGSFRTLNGADLPAPYFRLNPDLTIDPTFQIAASDNPRPADLAQARIVSYPDGGIIAYRDPTGITRLTQRRAADGSLVQSFSVTPTFGDLLVNFLARADGTVLYVEHRFYDFAKRIRLLRADGTRGGGTDLDVEFMWEERLANAVDGAVLVSAVRSVAGQRRYGLARLIPKSAGATGVDPARLINVSARVTIGANESQAIAGFVLNSGPHPLLIRGIGPGLRTFGVQGALESAQVQVFAGQALMAANTGWGTSAALRDAFLAVGAFPLVDGSADAALIASMPAGGATVIFGPAGSARGGVGLLEIYDLDGRGARALRNLSVRAEAGRENAGVTAGFVIAGTGLARVLVRAVGPALREYGVTAALADPRLRIYSPRNLRGAVAENDNWAADAISAAILGGAAVEAGAFALPRGSRDAALLLALEPGTYTAELTSMDGTTGIALVEVYLLDD